MDRAVTVGYEDRIHWGQAEQADMGLCFIVIGIQHHILAQLFLVRFDPGIPKVGTNRQTAMKTMSVSVRQGCPIPRELPLRLTRLQQRIEELMRELCGIGSYNRWSPPAMFTACMGIAMCKD